MALYVSLEVSLKLHQFYDFAKDVSRPFLFCLFVFCFFFCFSGTSEYFQCCDVIKINWPITSGHIDKRQASLADLVHYPIKNERWYDETDPFNSNFGRELIYKVSYTLTVLILLTMASLQLETQRIIYIITYSRADTLKFPTKESFSLSLALIEAWN